MGEVVETLKIMPESPDVDLEALKAATPVLTFSIVGFGLISL